jgi:Na+/H+-dicarboxylate symporter
MTEKKSISLTSKIFIGLILGIIVGFILQAVPPGTFRDTILVGGLFHFVGNGFLNAIFMIVPPLILVSLVVGITTITDPKKVGRIGGKLSLFYLLSTFPAIGIAMVFGFLINPARFAAEEDILYLEPTIATPPGVIDVLLGIIPRNPFAALAGGATLQIIFIAVVIGLAMVALGRVAKPAYDGFVAFNEIIMKVTKVILKVAPYGVFALIAITFSRLGLGAILALLAFVLTVWLALIFHLVVIYGGALKILVGKDPTTGKSLRVSTLFRKAIPALAFAFASASSAATLPITMKCGRNMGFKKEMASVTFPLGVTLNMDGTAIFQGVAIIFLAGFYGVELTVGMVLTVLITATLATLGTAGVPGAGMIMLSIVLTSIGMPVEAIAIIFGIDRIVDMPRTAINVCGDFIYGMIVAKQEGMIDWEQFNSDVDIAAIEEAQAKAKAEAEDAAEAAAEAAAEENA